ncbi:MAG: RNA 2',3'-cyclic phosphodiesterase [Gemmatimonadetes bacterium]|nr:RNA 2',3'-cyclic phosphodiesterase [Gemmatimonadota bacterium]
MRLFFAVGLGESAFEGIAPVVERIPGRELLPMRWVRPATYHMTIRFLGDMEEKNLAALDSAGERAARRVNPFKASLGAPGVFPDRENPRVLWFGLKEGSDGMTALATAVNGELALAMALPDEERFHPHVTIGRTKSPLDAGATHDFMMLPGPDVSWPVRELQLVESELTNEGARYRVRRAFPLAPA